MSLAWKWIRKNVTLLMLLTAMICLVLALGELVRGATWSLFMPVSIVAVLCGWGLGREKLKPKQAWVSLIALGVLGVFIYVGGLVRSLARLILSIFSLIPQIASWISDKVLIDTRLLLVTWEELTSHIASLFLRLWAWWAALLAGSPFVDPLAAGLVWSILLWLIGAWAGWKMRRERQALPALIPGSILLALVLNYTRGEVAALIMYLAILLVLMGLARVEHMHVRWEQRKLEYAESIRIETLTMAGMVTIMLVLLAANAPSLSWRELMDKMQHRNQASENHAAEALGLERPINVASTEAYRANGLPRSHLLDTPPELLQDVVMTVTTGELPTAPETTVNIEPNHYYWRKITYDIYSGAGWLSSPAQEILLPADTPLLEAPDGYRTINQRIQQGADQDWALYWTGILGQVDVDTDIAWRAKPPGDPDPLHVGDMLGGLTDSTEFTVTSYSPQFSAAQLRTANSNYPPKIVERYLQLPENTPERVLALARELTQTAPTPYDRTLAIEAYLRTFPYTLETEPPPRGRDVVDYFLFTAQQGYCDYYATSMVVLARAVGLPARIVIGYTSGEYDSLTAEYIIRRENAHSWVEIYFSGFGWVEFEPTAGQPAIARSGETNASVTPPSLPGDPSAFSWLKAQGRALLSSLGGQFLSAGLVLILLFTLWRAGEISLLYLIPTHRAIPYMYSHIERATINLLPDLPNGHTPNELSAALTRKLKSYKNHVLATILFPASKEIERIVFLYVSQAFSEHPPAKSQVRVGIRAWFRLRWRLWFTNRWDRYLARQSRKT